MADLIITAIIFLVQKLLLPALPTSIGFLPIASFTDTLNAIQANLIYSLSGINFFMPVDLLFALILLVIFAEMSLFTFKMGVFIINLVRGSGA
jgi:hypothetical protein